MGVRTALPHFNERSLSLFALALTLATAAEFAPGLVQWALGGPSPWHNANCIDFTWLWLAGKFAASSAPVHAYNYSAFVAAKLALVPSPSCVLEHVDYPPTLFFFLYPLTPLPYEPAFVAWMAVTVAVYLAAVYAIIPHRTAVISALVPAPVWMNVWLGHNGFLTAGFMGLALAFAENRPRLAAVPLSLLTYKPQFGILFPFALAAGRKWQTIFVAATFSILFAALAVVTFGYATWPAFAQSVAERSTALVNDPALVIYFVSILHLLATGETARATWFIQLVASACIAGVTCLVWARPSFPYALKAATIAFGSILVSPHVFSYDLCILTIGVAFFVRDGLSRGFSRGERGFLLACWLILYLIWVPSWPVPLLVCYALLGLTLSRGLRYPTGESAIQAKEEIRMTARLVEPI